MASENKILRRIGKRGQITIPADILRSIGLMVGGYVGVESKGEHIVLVPHTK
jgi:AbrB family looped-hinge helix DNA binding protein